MILKLKLNQANLIYTYEFHKLVNGFKFKLI